MHPPIRWTGSKRYVEKEILELFPKTIDTYYEPFIGGGSILLALLKSNIKFNSVIASDINGDLINLWLAIKNNPASICNDYANMWQEMQQMPDEDSKNNFFIKKRSEFNKDKETSKFLFLNRTCYNGLIRYNKSGNYNSPYHWRRPGIEPAKLLEIMNSVSNILSKNNVTFKKCDYSESVSNAKSGDFAFFDPPYFETKAIYSCGLDFDSLCKTIKTIKCNFVMSYNGTRNAEHIIELPTELYDRKVLLKESMSGFSKLKGKLDVVREYAYIKGKYESSEVSAPNIWE